jgi:SAM-dependent methyltransferase
MPPPVAARQPEGKGAGWFHEPLALRLLQEEQRQAIPPLTGCYGTTGLYLRPAQGAPPELSGNMLQCVLRLHRASGGLAGDVSCFEAQLPLQRECIDLAYLLHALETSDDPRELLLEMERVLAPEGNLMLVVLNPFSLWRLRWHGHGLRAIGAGRARQLLRETGFEVVRQYGLGPVWPWLRARPWVAVPLAGSPDAFSVWRAGFLIQARKRRRGMTPVRPRAGAVSLAPGMHPG